MTAVEKAKALGTFEADDRSQQYPLHEQKLVHKAINDCWTKVHQLETAGKLKDKEIKELKKKNVALTSLITSALAYALIECAKLLFLR